MRLSPRGAAALTSRRESVLPAGRQAILPQGVKFPLHDLELTAELDDVELRADAGEELGAVDRLGQELADAAVHALEPRVEVVTGGEEDDRDAGAAVAQRGADLEAVHAGHHDVEQDQVDTPLADHAQAFLARVGLLRAVSLALQQAGGNVARTGVVVDHEDAGWLGGERHSDTSCSSSASSPRRRRSFATRVV